MCYLLLYTWLNRLLKPLDTYYKEDQYNYIFIERRYLGNTCYCHFNKCLNVPTYMVEVITHFAISLLLTINKSVFIKLPCQLPTLALKWIQNFLSLSEVEQEWRRNLPGTDEHLPPPYSPSIKMFTGQFGILCLFMV